MWITGEIAARRRMIEDLLERERPLDGRTVGRRLVRPTEVIEIALLDLRLEPRGWMHRRRIELQSSADRVRCPVPVAAHLDVGHAGNRCAVVGPVAAEIRRV